jgi:hypothetical protein
LQTEAGVTARAATVVSLKSLMLAAVIVGCGYLLSMTVLPIHWSAMLVLLATVVAAHGFLLVHRYEISKAFLKAIDYPVIVSAALGISGAAQLHMRYVQHEVPAAAAEMKEAKSALVREYQALRARCDSPEISLDYSDEQNEAIAKEWETTERDSRNKLCSYVRRNEDPEPLLSRDPFEFINTTLDLGRYAERPLKLRPFNEAIGRYLRADILVQRFAPYTTTEEDFSLEALGWMLIALGLGLRLSRTTAEILEWHT